MTNSLNLLFMRYICFFALLLLFAACKTTHPDTQSTTQVQQHDSLVQYSQERRTQTLSLDQWQEVEWEMDTGSITPPTDTLSPFPALATFTEVKQGKAHKVVMRAPHLSKNQASDPTASPRPTANPADASEATPKATPAPFSTAGTRDSQTALVETLLGGTCSSDGDNNSEAWKVKPVNTWGWVCGWKSELSFVIISLSLPL